MTNNVFRPLLITLVIIVSGLVIPKTGRCAVIEGVTFNNAVMADDARLVLKGTALLRYLVFIKAYVGAFYLPEGVDSKQALTEVPRQLVLEYFHGIRAGQFDEATRVTIKENVSPGSLARMQPKIDQLGAAYRDVKPGDRYILTYVPGVGTRLALNDKVLVVIPGADFSKAVFSIWIGENPIDASFRDNILGIGR